MIATDELRRLEEQLRRAFEGEAWHGPSLMEALDGITAEQAAATPSTGGHSIQELARHVLATYGLVLRRLDGNGAPLTPEQDWPETPSAWQETIAALRRANQALCDRLRTFPHEELERQLVPESPTTAYQNFIGIMQHDLYHAGQIVLLKRAQAGGH
jgi:uncharacterized damage-inducible protein DinB